MCLSHCFSIIYEPPNGNPHSLNPLRSPAGGGSTGSGSGRGERGFPVATGVHTTTSYGGEAPTARWVSRGIANHANSNVPRGPGFLAVSRISMAPAFNPCPGPCALSSNRNKNYNSTVCNKSSSPPVCGAAPASPALPRRAMPQRPARAPASWRPDWSCMRFGCCCW